MKGEGCWVRKGKRIGKEYPGKGALANKRNWENFARE